jgi:hypothetical protein
MYTVLRRVQVVVAIGLAALLAYPSVWALLAHKQVDALEFVGRGVLLLLACGVAARWRAALQFAAAMLVVAMLFLPLVFLNLFMLVDGIEQPSVVETLIWLIPAELCLALSAWVLDPKSLAHNES